MAIRLILLVAMVFFVFTTVAAQFYESDSLGIEIRSKNNFLVKDFKDLDIGIFFSAKLNTKKTYVYQSLEIAYRGTFGNCFYELYKYDTTVKGFKNITFDIMRNHHAPKEFKSPEEICTYDLEKVPLGHGEKKVLTFNLLNFIYTLPKGNYSMIIYLRVANNYGYDKNKRVITNSISYLESSNINFDVVADINAQNKF